MNDDILLCNSCGRPMVATKTGEGMRFECTCGQLCKLGIDGRLTMIILPRLFPEQMDEQSPTYQQFLDYRIREVTFDANIRRICGLITMAEANEWIATIGQLVADKRRELTSRRSRELPLATDAPRAKRKSRIFAWFGR